MHERYPKISLKFGNEKSNILYHNQNFKVANIDILYAVDRNVDRDASFPFFNRLLFWPPP